MPADSPALDIGAQGHYKFSDADHIGGHGGFYQWQYTVDEGFKFVRDLNAESDLFPESLEATMNTK